MWWFGVVGRAGQPRKEAVAAMTAACRPRVWDSDTAGCRGKKRTDRRLLIQKGEEELKQGSKIPSANVGGSLPLPGKQAGLSLKRIILEAKRAIAIEDMNKGVDDDELLLEGASARAPARTTGVNLVVEVLVLPRLALTLAMRVTYRGSRGDFGGGKSIEIIQNLFNFFPFFQNQTVEEILKTFEKGEKGQRCDRLSCYDYGFCRVDFGVRVKKKKKIRKGRVSVGYCCTFRVSSKKCC
ncbi:hypothetical protein H5410_034358 [Solanum commersonii]|uniref:Uncharacterized protein n=1 Tax=Solanum commersonii TaxID=4109 RepID=A0A9J5YVB8_SOLCO|nr:hypothetical protein H5410_034358 [Solanum commersonii]